MFESPHNALQALEARHVCQWIVSLVDSFDSGHKILYIVCFKPSGKIEYIFTYSVLFWIKFLEMILNTFEKALFDFAIW